MRFVLTDKDAVPTQLNYDYTCDNWTDAGASLGLTPELEALSSQYKIKSYFCELRYRQFDFKPGVYSISFFYNSTQPPRNKMKEETKNEEQKTTKRTTLEKDLASFMEDFGINVIVTPVVGLGLLFLSFFFFNHVLMFCLLSYPKSDRL